MRGGLGGVVLPNRCIHFSLKLPAASVQTALSHTCMLVERAWWTMEVDANDEGGQGEVSIKVRVLRHSAVE